MAHGMNTKGWLVVVAVSLGACQLVVATEEFAESSVQCHDGIDNDIDGVTDCADDGCGEACGIGSNCGNRAVDPGEECDLGPGSPDCDADCTAAYCGDFFINPYRNESCDDGNQLDRDGCSAQCSFEDGTGGVAFCGDGISQPGEQCDDGVETPVCDRDCTVAYCGDFHVNPARDESCDDGNQNNGDGCSASCTHESETAGFCGDGMVQAGEECDTVGESAGCDADCTFAFCGDLQINPTRNETCDDGNQDNGDGCDSSCNLEP